MCLVTVECLKLTICHAQKSRFHNSITTEYLSVGGIQTHNITCSRCAALPLCSYKKNCTPLQLMYMYSALQNFIMAYMHFSSPFIIHFYRNAFCGQIQCGGDGELLTTPGIPVRFTLRSESFTCK